MRVLVTGASGFIGSAVVADLQAAGHTVTGTARSDDAADRLRRTGAQVARVDVTDTAEVAGAASTVDSVVHLAYRHDAAQADAVATDRAVVEALGDVLAGTGRQLVVTSGTLVLPAGRLGAETDPADSAAPAGARGGNESLALALAARDVRVSVVRLAPSVHDTVRRGFVGALIDIAHRTGLAGFAGDGSARWPAVHRQDAASLYRLALERAPAGTVLHGVGQQGVSLGELAEVIGARLHLPVRRVPDDDLSDHFGWLAGLVDLDASASSDLTQRALDWHPRHPGLVEDLRHGRFFDEAPR